MANFSANRNLSIQINPQKNAKLNGSDSDFDGSAYIWMVLVTHIEGIQFFFNLTSCFQIYGTFKFYENVNFREKVFFKNPHCTKYISHRTI